MRVLVVSDNHGKLDNLIRVMEIEGSFDRLIHCGDVEDTEWEIMGLFDCPCDIVAGNNDYFSDLPYEKELDIGGLKALLTHGHNYYVYMDQKTLVREAQARGMDIVFYGHTHRPSVQRSGSVLVINPGSLSYPRQEGRHPSYVVMEIKDGEVFVEVRYV